MASLPTDVCMHAIVTHPDFHNATDRYTLNKLEMILTSGYLLSLRLQEKEEEAWGCNGVDYISLCCPCNNNTIASRDYLSIYPYKTAYHQWISKSLSLVFPTDKIDIIKTELTDIYWPYFDWRNQKKPISDCPDEVQVKGSISLDNMIALTVPVYKMNPVGSPGSITISPDLVTREIKKVRALLTQYGYDIPIYDILSLLPLDTPENIEAATEHARARLRKREI